ncbi:MAG: Long-chain-fatty-acid--CoA ligase FadD17 [Candidatus Lokiarchaeum sp. GC14_75]|nr:MAG: Long-chain-fatty-acid--CoA ligase FadD17 [Candidatus Lokiarchaeum sp. GC14_75]
MEIQLTTKEKDYLERLEEVVKKRTENPNLSLGIMVEQNAENLPDHTAFLFEDSSWTWQSLNQESNKISNFFLKLGIESGDIVTIMMENSAEFLFITTGINKIQGISSLININQRKQALIHAFEISEGKWFIIDGSSLKAFNEVFDDLNIAKENVFVSNNLENLEHPFRDLRKILDEISQNNPDTTFKSNLRDDSTYIFTSGTTGLPKAAVQNNARLLNPFGMLALKLTPKDVLYSPLPLYHSLSMIVGWAAVVQGGSAFGFRKRFSASEFWNDVKKFGATCCLYIGEVPRYLINRPKSEYVENNTFKKMLGLGLRKDIWETFKSRFHVQHILEFYGATEGAGGLFNVNEKPGMIGRITIPKSIIVVKVNEETGEFYKDEQGFLIQCSPGETGMMLAIILPTGNFKGYKDKSKTNERVLNNVLEENDSYFNTGDLVSLHEDHWVSFADRFGDTYRWKGENVSTMEVESILNTFEGMDMCNVYGVEMPDAEGKAGMISIVCEDKTFDTDSFSKFISENLPKYTIPIFIRIKDELEFTGTHKLRKVNLRKQGFDVDKIKDRIYFWNSKSSKYELFDREQYQNVINGKLKF